MIRKFVSLILLISLRFLLESISDCPPDKKAIPGTLLGTFFLRQSKVFLAIYSELDFSLHSVPGKIIFGFKTVPFKSTL